MQLRPTECTLSCTCRQCREERDAELSGGRLLRQLEGETTLAYEIELVKPCDCGARVVLVTIGIP